MWIESPVAIDLFCSLVSESSVTEIQLSKTTGTFSRLIRANDIITAFPFTERDTRFAKIIGVIQAGKRAHSLFNCISVTDDIEINEQNKSIATGLLYAHSEFDVF